jgi:predicted RNase H-like nuclease
MRTGTYHSSRHFIGLDLAWGERNPDGMAWLKASGRKLEIGAIERIHGDDATLAWILGKIGKSKRVFLAMDAPVVCPNPTGSRPVDKLTHQLFGKFHAGCYPANQALCGRPVRMARRLEAAGFKKGWATEGRTLAEVYPHPAMIRAFGLDRILKYKKGSVAEKCKGFRLYQQHFRRLLESDWKSYQITGWEKIEALLALTWTKEAEDKTDALFCAWIALHHVRHQGKRSEVIGDRETGFILLPQVRKNSHLDRSDT